jgi:hypothetical protein
MQVPEGVIIDLNKGWLTVGLGDTLGSGGPLARLQPEPLRRRSPTKVFCWNSLFERNK